MEKKWIVAEPMPKDFQDNFPEVSPVVLQLLYNRNLKTQDEIDEFTNPDYGQDIHDPYLFKDMKKVIARIQQALKNKEKILVHGDYDADGVCGAAIIVSALKIIDPDCNVDVYLPHREIEGYGMNVNSVEEFSKNGVSLIITADCGTSNIEEVKLANERNIDVIITDHHVPHEELPAAYGIINAWVEGENYPCQQLAGSGVAFKLCQALLKENKIEEAQEKWLLDLVAIGTIGDYVPLVGENRTLTKYGMIVLKKTRRLGLQSLMKVINLPVNKIDTRSIAFQLVPKLNAAGRVDHANTAYQLLVSGLKEEADKVAVGLNKLNQERQKITERMTQEAKAQLGEVTDDQYVLMAEGKDWPAGLVGLVASRLMDEYCRPTIIVGRRQGLVIGSGRSLPEFHIANALKELEDLFTHYGGHRQACGFTLKDGVKVSDLKKAINNLARQQLKTEDMAPKVYVDMEIKFNQIDWDLVQVLESFAPYGEGNSTPLLVSKQLEVIDWERVGADRKHLRLVVRDDSMVVRRFIGFGFGHWGDKLTTQDRIDAVYELGVNEWNGTRELQLKLVDLKYSKV